MLTFHDIADVQDDATAHDDANFHESYCSQWCTVCVVPCEQLLFPVTLFLFYGAGLCTPAHMNQSRTDKGR